MARRKFQYDLDKDDRFLIGNLAKSRLGIATLETRNSDNLDFHEVAVWQVQEALERAFERGYEKCEEKHREIDEGLYILETSHVYQYGKPLPSREILRMSKAEAAEKLGSEELFDRLMNGEVVERKGLPGVYYVEMFLAARKLQRQARPEREEE